MGYGGEEGDYIIYACRYTVTTGMTFALSWAAMRAILMFHNCEEQSHKTVSTDHNFWRERRAEADSNWGLSTFQSNALPLGQTGSHRCRHLSIFFCWCVFVVQAIPGILSSLLWQRQLSRGDCDKIIKSPMASCWYQWTDRTQNNKIK